MKEKFKEYFELAKECLEQVNFSGQELAQVSSELALKLLEAEFAQKRLNAELELQKRQQKQAEAEALKSIVQAESMIRSVRDNALISKANAYVGFLNVMLNATNIDGDKNVGGSNHSSNVIKTISAVDDSPLSNYSQSLEELKKDILELAK
ncbi:hypothetical protein CQA49_00045 [Helicobacter sp. MIT 00-7814]|uniref:hypothetical protein n=1 Tax=unclassified Helicobacter TaxID=2593540 RepID=UPI000E1E5768|nr:MULTISPECIES: hypothetical protein [unclassified Helicobacter]RDU57095.1 hypothetical protein CQA49_00045 [Helicobacter sp. MIT 00-7814]RDU57646.1 hypothetical protein CQA37_00045 [Helicobacter sp. MIT 99-10781]